MDLFNTTRQEREAAIFAHVPNAKRVHSLTSGIMVAVTFKNGTTRQISDYHGLSKWIWEARLATGH